MDLLEVIMPGEDWHLDNRIVSGNYQLKNSAEIELKKNSGSKGKETEIGKTSFKERVYEAATHKIFASSDLGSFAKTIAAKILVIASSFFGVDFSNRYKKFDQDNSPLIRHINQHCAKHALEDYNMSKMTPEMAQKVVYSEIQKAVKKHDLYALNKLARDKRLDMTADQGLISDLKDYRSRLTQFNQQPPESKTDVQTASKKDIRSAFQNMPNKGSPLAIMQSDRGVFEDMKTWAESGQKGQLFTYAEDYTNFKEEASLEEAGKKLTDMLQYFGDHGKDESEAGSTVGLGYSFGFLNPGEALPVDMELNIDPATDAFVGAQRQSQTVSDCVKELRAISKAPLNAESKERADDLLAAVFEHACINDVTWTGILTQYDHHLMQ